MSTKVAVVVPVYRELNELEKISVAQCRKVLSRYPLIFVAPEGKNFSFVKPGDMVAQFPARYFQSTKTYSELLMTPQFYETFADFDYILIYQTDAFVFYDALEEFCALGYDYIGSPWPYCAWPEFNPQQKTLRVGNGGFSLRKVKACQRIVRDFTSRAAQDISEDMFLSKCAAARDIDFNAAPVAVANLFAMEWFPARHVRHFGLPFGCHFWNRFGADFYVKTFRRFGYDLQPLREMLGDEDCEHRRVFPVEFAMKRLIRAAEHGQSVLQYLPTKKFASIRIIRSAGTMKLLSRLLTEDDGWPEAVFAYDAAAWTNLLRDVTPEDLPHLLIVADYDASLIKALERGGLRYGQHFVSLQREYMKACELILRSFGRRGD